MLMGAYQPRFQSWVAGRTELELPRTRNGHPKVPDTTYHRRRASK